MTTIFPCSIIGVILCVFFSLLLSCSRLESKIVWIMEPSLFSIRALIIMDDDGHRVLAHYYDQTSFPNLTTQTAFEAQLFAKTKKGNVEIAMLDDNTCLCKSNVDLLFYVVAAATENELVLLSVLNCMYDVVSLILRRNVERSAIFDNMEVVMLGLDEICDGGIVLETDPTTVVSRVAVRSEDVPLAEQTVAQVLQTAKEQLKWSLSK